MQKVQPKLTLNCDTSTEGFPYPSRRTPVFATRGVVASSQALAAQAGLQTLRRGGNAVDAAVATAITLTVVEPTANGIGADSFALVWDGAKLHGLNSSGRAPAAHTPELFAQLGLTGVPQRGWLSVTVPGAVAGWRALHERFGKLPFESLFENAIYYAENGWPVSPVNANAWGGAYQTYRTVYGDEPAFQPWFKTFTIGGHPPRAGELWGSPDHARTLRLIAESKGDAFYKGELAIAIENFAAATGGYVTRADMAAHTSTWVDPIHTTYKDYDVWEIPPNGQGIIALEALNILEGLGVADHPRESVESYHLQIEALKLAFSDAIAYVADSERANVPTQRLLDKSYAADRRKLIGSKALEPAPGHIERGGTVYFAAADADGMMISMIQSNYTGFGSGVVIPGTGIALHNRGYGFTLEPGHPNQVAGGKRPRHTIIPSFLTQNGTAVGPFGVMGADMQPQGHLQMVVNQVDYGLNPQASLDAPRWRWAGGREVRVEPGVSAEIVAGLQARGHEIIVDESWGPYGKGQIIRRLANGAYVAGSEPRSDGQAAAW